MKREEYDEIIQLLYTIQKIAYDKYTNIYMPHFNSLGGNVLVPIPAPESLAGIRPIISVNDAIQMTNVTFVYQLNHCIMHRAKRVQNQPPRRTAYQMEVDGVNYMVNMMNEMTAKRGLPNRHQVSELSYQAKYQDLITTLKSILAELQKI